MPDSHPDALPVGSELEEYRIESVLGRGGFGVTYLAFDRHLSRRVAIKEYLPIEFANRDRDATVRVSASTDDDAFQRGLDGFLREAQILARFRHPNIVAVRRFFRCNGTGYLVMDYEEGESLTQFLHRSPKPSATLLRRWLDGLLDGLRGVHEAGILHRDIKPSNIYLRRDGEPVLLDFGASRPVGSQNTRPVTSICTPGYAPLEQYDSGSDQGPWTDIYAVGAVMYRAITGELPPDAAARALADRMVPLVERGRGLYPDAFLAALDATLALEPRRRPQSVAELRRMLGEPSEAETRALPMPSDLTRPAPEIVAGRVSRLRIAAGAVAAAGLVAVVILTAVPPPRPVSMARELRERGDQEIARGDQFAAVESYMLASQAAATTQTGPSAPDDAEVEAAERGLARLREVTPSARVPSLDGDVTLRLFEKGPGDDPSFGRADYRDRFSGTVARFVCFEVESVHEPIPTRVESSFAAVLYKNGAAYATSDRMTRRTDPGARTSWFRNCIGGKTPGRWEPGPYRFDIYFDGQKAVSHAFVITE